MYSFVLFCIFSSFPMLCYRVKNFAKILPKSNFLPIGFNQRLLYDFHIVINNFCLSVEIVIDSSLNPVYFCAVRWFAMSVIFITLSYQINF